MDIRKISDDLSVSPQITPADLTAVRAAGFRAIICNRPDGEGADQPTHAEIEAAAAAAGLAARYLPVTSGKVRDEDAAAFGRAMAELPGPVLAFCRTGTRSATLWSLSEARRRPVAEILAATRAAGHDMAGVVRRIVNGGKSPTDTGDAKVDVVIVGAGAAGINGRAPVAQYDGYGSCPLTVERGKIVLAEFGYGGVLKPSFPKLLLDGTKPSRAAWFLKERMLPPIYWKVMLRGREWLAKPEKIAAKPVA